MMTVPLYGQNARGRVALVDDEDYELVIQYRWFAWEFICVPGRRPAGPYALRNTRLNGRKSTQRLHRLLLHGVPRIDHEDGNGLNCQRANLRPASAELNAANARKGGNYAGRPASSQYKGVYWNRTRSKWHAQITVQGRRRFLGYFADERDAALAYDAAAYAAWGEFACPNFPGVQPG